MNLSSEDVDLICNKFSIESNNKMIKKGEGLKDMKISDTCGATGEGRKLSSRILEETYLRYSPIFEIFGYKSY